jgi:hypothetical protein
MSKWQHRARQLCETAANASPAVTTILAEVGICL